MSENTPAPVSKIATMTPLVSATVGIEYDRDGDLPFTRSDQGATMAIVYARIEFTGLDGTWEFERAVCDGLYVHEADGFSLTTGLAQHATIGATRTRESWLTLAILAAARQLPTLPGTVDAGQARAIAAELAEAPLKGLEALYWGSRHYLDIIAETAGTASPLYQALRTTREPLRRLLAALRVADQSGASDA